jgi:hypothetical protein
MNVQPQLEELEERSALSLADLAAFQQQFLPQLQAQFHALVPVVQSTLQTNLNQQKAALAPLFPAASQPALGALFAQEQQFVNTFPALANVWFRQTVANFEAQLLSPLAAPQSLPRGPVAVIASPGFFPFFPFFGGGFFGFPFVAPVALGGGAAFTSGSSFSFVTGSSFTDPPGQTGRGMGMGLMSTVGALTIG